MSADLNSILQTMVANPGQGMSAVATQALMSQFADDDPTASLLTAYLTQRKAATVQEEDPDKDSVREAEQCALELERARTRSQKTAAAVGELREQIEKLFAELETLRERNDTLAE